MKKRASFRTAIVESCDGREAGSIDKVERVVHNALTKTAALPPDICAFGESNWHRLEDKTIHLDALRCTPSL